MGDRLIDEPGTQGGTSTPPAVGACKVLGLLDRCLASTPYRPTAGGFDAQAGGCRPCRAALQLQGSTRQQLACGCCVFRSDRSSDAAAGVDRLHVLSTSSSAPIRRPPAPTHTGAGDREGGPAVSCPCGRSLLRTALCVVVRAGRDCRSIS
jgi:hypothetical protein